MIHHISISAQNLQRVAQVLAEIFKGQAVPFPPHPGSYMTVAMNEHGTAIEVYPSGVQLIPSSGQNGCGFGQNSQPSQFAEPVEAIA